MPAQMKDLRRFDARYHRNGSAEGFTVCSFLWLRGEKTKELHAIVWDDRIAVYNPEDISDRYEAAYFTMALRMSLAAMEKAQPEKLYERKYD